MVAVYPNYSSKHTITITRLLIGEILNCQSNMILSEFSQSIICQTWPWMTEKSWDELNDSSGQCVQLFNV